MTYMLNCRKGIYFLVIFAAMALANCSSIPLMSLPKLMALDPETIELAGIELAVRVPETVEIKHDSVTLALSMNSKTSSDKLREQFVLQHNPAPLTKYLKKQEKRKYEISRFKMKASDIAVADEFRKNVLAFRKASPKKPRMSVSAYARFCAKAGSPTISNINMTFYVRTNPKKKFYTLFKEQSVPIKGNKGLSPCVVKKK